MNLHVIAKFAYELVNDTQMKLNALALILCASIVMAACSTRNDLEQQLSAYVDSCDAEIGIAVIRDNGDTIVINDGEYPMNSVLKLFQSLPTALEMSKRGIAPDSMVTIAKSALQSNTWSPMLNEFQSDTLSIPYAKILEYALTESDNNACDWMFANVACIDSVSSFWAKIGLDGYQLKWNEAQMHEDPARSDENYTSPLTAAVVVKNVFLRSLVSSDLAVSKIMGILVGCKTGTNRIPAGISDANVIVAHKTGTGFSDSDGFPTGINDVAHVVLPNGRSYSLAVFVKSTNTDLEAAEKMIADISSIVYQSIKQ